MTCSERERLFDHYYDQVSNCFKELQKPSNRLWFFGADSKLRAIAAEAQRARVALERHEREHGCGKLGGETEPALEYGQSECVAMTR
jgi:hypothetical protein